MPIVLINAPQNRPQGVSRAFDEPKYPFAKIAYKAFPFFYRLQDTRPLKSNTEWRRDRKSISDFPNEVVEHLFYF